jgi:hypothetical protein
MIMPHGIVIAHRFSVLGGIVAMFDHFGRSKSRRQEERGIGVDTRLDAANIIRPCAARDSAYKQYKTQPHRI